MAQPILTTLRRAHDGELAGRGRWAAYRMADSAPTIVFFTCPFCGVIGSTGARPNDAGLVASRVACSSDSCGFTYQIQLEGWGELALEARGAVPDEDA